MRKLTGDCLGAKHDYEMLLKLGAGKDTSRLQQLAQQMEQCQNGKGVGESLMNAKQVCIGFGLGVVAAGTE